MNKIKLGMIGLSEGNGHPYSWSAIINGYDAEKMSRCPFPVIPQYLAKEKFPEAKISNAEVTHIWTQDETISRHIAESNYISHIVLNMEEMISQVDGILLARDDAENHVAMAKPFLEAGLPIYIDKPIAFKRSDVDLLYSLQKYQGQIFSCSAFQYAKEIIEAQKELKSQKILHVDGYIKNSWNKYAIHLIEPFLKIVGHDLQLKTINNYFSPEHCVVNYFFENNLTCQLKTFKSTQVKPSLHFYCEDNCISVEFEDTFYCFKNALQHFIDGIIQRKQHTKKEFLLRSIEMLEYGIGVNEEVRVTLQNKIIVNEHSI